MMSKLKVHTTEKMYQDCIQKGSLARMFGDNTVVYSEMAVRAAIVRALKWYQSELAQKDGE